jgi:hypothetical protein
MQQHKEKKYLKIENISFQKRTVKLESNCFQEFNFYLLLLTSDYKNLVIVVTRAPLRPGFVPGTLLSHWPASFVPPLVPTFRK